MELELSELKTQLENVELTEKQKSKLQKKYDKVKSKHERQLELKRQQDLAEENDESKGKYGELPLNQSQQKTNTVYASFTKLSDFLDKDVVVIGRVHAIRGKGKMVFVVIRQGYETLQCIIQQSEGFSKLMLKFIQQQQPESMVKIKGVVKTAEVSGCTLKSLELQIHEFFVFAKLKRDLPFTIEQAMVNENDEETLHSKVHLDTKLNNRVLDLRTITNHAIFKIQSQMCLYFRQYLQGLGFIEIHTPKLNGSASEGGASVFKVQYFNRNAYLAQSPQLYKQMLICSDFNRVFEIGPVFRSEDSNTHRHMTEFMGLDLEMAFNEHYDEVIQVIGDVLIHIFDELKSKCGRELEIINKQHPFTPLKYKHKGELLRLTFAEGIKMLQESGVDIQENQDINTTNEKLLGKLVLQKYDVDFYMLDKFPLHIRPFYTMPDPVNPKLSNSYDFFLRGEEILSGAQRVHDPDMLAKRAEECGIEVSSIAPYVDAFKYGASPHGGCGIGLERLLMLYLNLGNIRMSALFPRDPSRLSP